MKYCDKVMLAGRCACVIFLAFGSQVAIADSLTVQSLKRDYYLSEPIVLHVTLHLTEPLTIPRHDPGEARRQQLRLGAN